MAKYAIEFKAHMEFNEYAYDFYTGESYVYQGETYLMFSRYQKDAKRYSSKKRAENALEKLYGRAANLWKGRVVEIEEET